MYYCITVCSLRITARSHLSHNHGPQHRYPFVLHVSWSRHARSQTLLLLATMTLYGHMEKTRTDGVLMKYTKIS